MKSKAGNRILSILLTTALAFGMMPVTAFAEDGGITGEPPVASPGTTGQASVTFDIPLNEFNETWFFLTEGVTLTDADLLAGVTAVDENGGSVTVTVKDAGGLDMANPVPKSAVFPNEPYIITYAAEHPVSGDEFTETRELFITPGLGEIEPTANGTTTWNSSTPPDISGWDGTGNTITVSSGASGTLTIPDGVTGLTINGGTGAPVEMNGSIDLSSVTNAITLNLNNVTINSNNADGAVHKAGGALTLNVTGTVTLNGQAGGGHALNAYILAIGGNGTLRATGGDTPGGAGGDGVRAGGVLTIHSGCTVHATGGSGGNSASGNGGNGGNGVHVAGGNITNNPGGVNIATGGNGGNGGNSATGAGGNGGFGAFAVGSISNNAGDAEDFTARGGFGGSGSPDGSGSSATNMAATNVLRIPGVRFALTSGSNLNLTKPATDWVFKTGDFLLPPADYELVSIRFEKIGGGGNTLTPGGLAGLGYDNSNGELTVPTPLSTHAGTSGKGALKPGNYKAIITFGDRVTPTIPFDYDVFFTLTGGSAPAPTPSPSRGSGSGGGSSSSNTAPASTWLERDPAAALAAGAKNRDENFARTRITGIYGVRGNAWDRLSGLRYEHDTLDGGAVQVRLYVKNPEKLTKDTRVSGYVKGYDVERVKSHFEKWFKNKLRVIHFDHSGAWGQPVEIAAKLDLAGMDTTNLYFYSYDKKANAYKRIEKPAYWIDKNGYLHFTVEYAGDIVVSEGPLEKK